MKSILLRTVCAIMLGTSSTITYSAIYDVSGSLTLRDSTGAITGSIDNTVYGIFDDSGSTSLSLKTTQVLYGEYWASTGVIYGPGEWTFNACPGDNSTFCDTPPPPRPISMSVEDGQWGGHLLTEWSVNQDIDVLNVWDVTINPSGTIILSSTDPDGDGILGIPMVDGPWQTFSWSYDLVLTPQPIPIPQALFLFCSGLLGLIGIARRKIIS